MIELQNTVIVNASSDKVWTWLKALPEHYSEWHADHISCRWLNGGALAVSAKMEVVELLHGKKHRLQMKITGIDPGRYVCYRIFPGLKGSIEIEARASGSIITTTITMGVGTPLLGKVIDALLVKIAGIQIESIRQHQAEEGANLKKLLEGKATGREPATDRIVSKV